MRPKASQSSFPPAKLTDVALVLAVGLCLARGMMLETLREPFAVVPGMSILRSPTAAVTAVLDWLSFVPAMLVCLRSAIDPTFQLRRSTGVVLMLGLGLWAMASTFWSADRLAAAVSAGKWLGGAAILWTLVQCVRDWRAFRIVAAAAAGLLAVLIIHSILYVKVDLPDMQRNWETLRSQVGMMPGGSDDSFARQQFERKVLSGELMGFVASPNSLAALVVMLAMVVVGEGLDRLRTRRGLAVLAAHVLLVGGAAWMIWRTDSRTAMATPLLGAALLAGGWMLGSRLAGRGRAVFWSSVGIVLAGWAAVIAHGLYHGSLFVRTLTFRWHYWVASMHLWWDQLWWGVGWENFGNHYLQYRLPAAPEEVRDPHNLFVRFAAELGVVGLALGVGWVLRMAWELTRPVQSNGSDEITPVAVRPPLQVVAPLIWIAAVATLVVILGGIDLSADPWYVLLEVMRRGMYGFVIVATMALLSVAELERPRPEQREAGLLLIAVTVGLGLFLVHNFIDFALFETGPFYVAIMLAGGVMGARQSAGREAAAATRPWVCLAGCGLAWIGMGVMVVVPTVLANQMVRNADAALATGRSSAAASMYAQAFHQSLWLRDGDILMRQTRAMLHSRAEIQRIRAVLDQLIEVNPRHIQAWMSRSQIHLALGEVKEAEADYQQAMTLNATDARMRLDAAIALRQAGQAEMARAMFLEALRLNRQLPEDEPERLSEAEINLAMEATGRL